MKKLSIYIHIPFCEQKCAYCNFVSSADKAADRVDAYVDALCGEIRDCGVGGKYVVDTIFLGGGTPSVLGEEHLDKIFVTLRAAFQIESGAEITIESNPNSLTLEKLKHYRAIGINRLSVGVQSLNEQKLRVLGRIHNAEQARRAIEMAESAGFTNVNIDLIHSVPMPKDKSGRGDEIAVNCATIGEFLARYSFITHVSVYSLIVETGTPLARAVESGELVLPSDEQSIREQRAIERVLREHGYKKYEVSNFAKSGCECRHNLNYWNPLGGKYLGFGVAAHSLFGNRRFANTEEIEEYLAGFGVGGKSAGVGAKGAHERSRDDLVAEAIMLGLRTVKGVRFDELRGVGFDPETVKAHEIAELKGLGLVKTNGERLWVVQKGFLVLNKIIEKLVP